MRREKLVAIKQVNHQGDFFAEISGRSTAIEANCCGRLKDLLSGPGPFRLLNRSSKKRTLMCSTFTLSVFFLLFFYWKLIGSPRGYLPIYSTAVGWTIVGMDGPLDSCMYEQGLKSNGLTKRRGGTKSCGETQWSIGDEGSSTLIAVYYTKIW